MLRWMIVKRFDRNADRPWQLWLSNGTAMALKAERSSREFCVQRMNRYVREGE